MRRLSTVAILGVVSLLNDLSTEMILPLLPLFLVGPLAAPVWAVGLMEGLGEATAALVRGASGVASDRVRRRLPFLVAGYGGSGLAKPAFALAAAWPHLVLLRFLDRAGKGLRVAPRDALIAESAGPERLGHGFGLHRALDTAGAFLGSLVGLVLFVALGAAGDGAFRVVFALAALPALASVAVLVLYVREPPAHTAHAARPLAPRDAFREPRLRRFLAATALFGLANLSFAFLLLRATDAGLPVVHAVALYVLSNGVYAAVAFPAGRLSDRVGRRRMLAASFLLFAALAALFAVATTLPLLVAGFVGYGVFLGIFEGGQKAVAAELAPPHLKATVLGVQTTLVGLVALPAGLAAGLLWEAFGPAATFGAAAAVAGVAAVGLASVERAT